MSKVTTMLYTGLNPETENCVDMDKLNIADMNLLYSAFRASMKGSAWKREPEKFEHDWLAELSAIKHELEGRTYKTSRGTEFELSERGKIRHIHGSKIRDRVVRHALCDEILTPSLKPYLIHNNGASQKGKGLSFAREQFENDLHRFYLKHGMGYVGLVDLSKFYDNIQHQKIKEMVYPKIPPECHWLMDEVLRSMEVDVSYMTDEEYASCLEEKFDSVAYYSADHPRTGKKMMAKSCNIGDQVSQDVGVFYPHRIDNYVKIVRGVKCYGRYMDDMYFITETKEEAKSLIKGIIEQAKENGLFINERKTRIVRMRDTFQFLQIKYFVTETGKVVKRINPKSVTRERRRLKAYRRLLNSGKLPYEDIEQAYKSWMGEYTKIMSRVQTRNMRELYKDLFGKDVRWK